MKRLIILFIILVSLFTLSCFQKKGSIGIGRNKKNNIDKLNEKLLDETFQYKNNRENFQIEVYGTYEGLQSDNIVDVAKNRDDFWLCSADGLIKFESETGRFINFPFTNNNVMPGFNSFEIADNDIVIGAQSGIYRFDIEKKVYNRVKTNVVIVPRVIQYKDGFLCSSVKGEIYYITDTVKKLTAGQGIDFESIKMIDDGLYLLSKSNVYNLDLDSKKFIKVVSSKDEISDFYRIKDNIYIAGKNLTEYNIAKTNNIILITFTNNRHITCLSYSEQNKLFFIGTSQGLGYYSLDKKEYKDLLTQYNKVKDAYINCISEDESMLFVGTKDYGLIKYKLYPVRLLWRHKFKYNI